MSKYNNLKFFKRTQARIGHKYYNCGKLIDPGDFYYSEKLKDRFLYSLHLKKFCKNCYQKYGNTLLINKKSNPEERQISPNPSEFIANWLNKVKWGDQQYL